LVGGEAIMTSQSIRWRLSLKLGILGGIIWGLIFTAYYSMLPNFEFAWKSASLCFAILVIVILALPSLYNAFKEAYREGKNK
jgi:high-affinity K+ transport system ATPase subunit B